MSLTTIIKTTLFALIMSLMAGQAVAHSSLTASLPGNGADVVSPQQLALTFNEPVRLLRLSLVHGENHQIDFGFQAVTAAQSEFVFDLPALMVGAHTVTWTIIGSDGHTVSNSFGFTVNPQAGEAHMENHSHDEHHHH